MANSVFGIAVVLKNEVALQTVQSVIWKEINTQLNMLNIKFYLLFEN